MEETFSIEIISQVKYNSGQYNLPHHAVVRPDHKTTKVQVVFYRKTKSNFSLKDVLHTGPTLQSDLITVILN